MHAAFRREPARLNLDPAFRAQFPKLVSKEAAAPFSCEPAPAPTSRYGARNGPNWGMIALILGLHAAGLFALVELDVVKLAPPKPAPLVVDLIRIAPPPPPAAPETKMVPRAKPVETPMVAPKAIITPIASPPPPVTVTTAPPPPQAVIVAPPAAKVATGPVSITDLASKVIYIYPAKYPAASHARHEAGTVYLSVLVGTNGRVQDISVGKSSGFDRLDEAALDAVRRWRWSPTMRGGEPVMVRGIVNISFVAKA